MGSRRAGGRPGRAPRRCPPPLGTSGGLPAHDRRTGARPQTLTRPRRAAHGPPARPQPRAAREQVPRRSSRRRCPGSRGSWQGSGGPDRHGASRRRAPRRPLARAHSCPAPAASGRYAAPPPVWPRAVDLDALALPARRRRPAARGPESSAAPDRPATLRLRKRAPSLRSGRRLGLPKEPAPSASSGQALSLPKGRAGRPRPPARGASFRRQAHP
jgi:hypothetical protein